MSATAQVSSVRAEGSRPLPSAEAFLSECRRKGIKLAVSEGKLIASGKPPANPEKFAAYLRAKKPELIAALSGERIAVEGSNLQLREGIATTEAPSAEELEKVGKVSPSPELVEAGRNQPGELKRVETENLALGLGQVGTGEEGDLRGLAGTSSSLLEALPRSLVRASVAPLYSDHRQKLLSWALGEAAKGMLPENRLPITLPSGQWVPVLGASAWLQEGQKRAERLKAQVDASVDSGRAFLILRQDLRALSLALARGWLSVWGGDVLLFDPSDRERFLSWVLAEKERLLTSGELVPLPEVGDLLVLIEETETEGQTLHQETSGASGLCRTKVFEFLRAR